MSDQTLHHRIAIDPRYRRERPCVWCGKPTQIMALTPFRPDLGAVPLMLSCGVFMRDYFNAMQAGEIPDPEDGPNFERFSRLLLESGE